MGWAQLIKSEFEERTHHPDDQPALRVLEWPESHYSTACKAAFFSKRCAVYWLIKQQEQEDPTLTNLKGLNLSELYKSAQAKWKNLRLSADEQPNWHTLASGPGSSGQQEANSREL